MKNATLAVLMAMSLGPWGRPASAENPQLDYGPYEISILWTVNHATRLETKIYETFLVPRDCTRFHHSWHRHGASTDGTGLRNVAGALMMCRRAEVLGSARRWAAHDFVSETDFSSLPLELVPPDMHATSWIHSHWSLDSTEAAIRKARQECAHLPSCPALSWPAIDATWERRGDHVERVDGESCRLRDGRFEGTTELREGTVFCNYEEPGGGLRLIDVRFRDFDDDGTMDAILTVVEARDGGTAPYTDDIFVLTRRSAGARLERLSAPGE